ncbi:MAG: DUF2252 domain-containing protein [Jatrophihabitantaceae bacterium]
MTNTLKRPQPSINGQPPRARRGLATRMSPVGLPADRLAVGKGQRQTSPLADHAWVPPPAARRDPIVLLEEQATERVPELVPIRYGRMMVTPFTFYRGAARVMASDLALGPSTDLTVQLCGDAHLSNFGLFASPERRLMFDANDFDETLPGPFEWDLKRLVASLAVAARGSGFSRKQRRAIVIGTVARYRAAMAEFAGMRAIDIWYSRLDTDDIERQLAPQLDLKRQKLMRKTFARARTRDSMQALGKLTETVNGRWRLAGDPPLIMPLRDLLPETEEEDLQDRFRALIGQYRRTLESDRRVLLENYQFVDMARKVVGVGSVGTRCWIVLLTGRDQNDPLFLQIKEATKSVLAEFLGRSEHLNQGQRVVHGQRLMQQASDIFLGWQRTVGIDDVQRDFYFRQLRDWKGGVEVEALLPKGLQYYGGLCAWSLARAHARSGDPIAIAGYLGSSDAFDRALADFAESYADLNEQDHQTLVAAATAGTVAVRDGL